MYAVFDIETRIDKGLVKAVYGGDGSESEADVYERVRAELVSRSGSDFFPVSFHVPITIVVGRVTADRVLEAVEAIEGSEEEMARRFWERVEGFEGALVSFNGRAFDLPVLELAALRYGCSVPRYFNEKYGARYRFSERRHYDLYEFLTNSGATRLRGGMDLIAKMIGLPGKGAVHGSEVQGLWEAGRLPEIVRYCRSDVIQTYLLFLRIELVRGRMTPADYERALAAAKPFRDELAAG